MDEAFTRHFVAQQLGAHQLLAPFGRGGMGEVHLAFDTRLKRKVAIKLLPAAFGFTERGRNNAAIGFTACEDHNVIAVLECFVRQSGRDISTVFGQAGGLAEQRAAFDGLQHDLITGVSARAQWHQYLYAAFDARDDRRRRAVFVARRRHQQEGKQRRRGRLRSARGFEFGIQLLVARAFLRDDGFERLLLRGEFLRALLGLGL
jgi:hypothetical protein